jgi:tetratricopeptide (TPR) repeat protein
MSAVALEERVEAARAPAALNLVDAEHPWLGLDSFSEETRQFFHGREEEVAELARRVRHKLLTILFGQSGLGKTSVLRAGIVPRLRQEGYCPVYVRVDYSRESPAPSEQIKRAIFRETDAIGKWTRPGAAVEGESLWEFLHHRDDLLQDERGKALVPLLIFDQFEEIFTIGQGDDFGRRRASEFIEDIADLVENRPPADLEQLLDSDESVADRFDFNRSDYRVLIALREDYLANLEAYRGSMPSVTQNRMRLARMTGAQALAAVMRPGGQLVNEEVAEAIVRFVAGGAELRNAEVEPSLLSLICRELNSARAAQGRTEISADLLAGSRETILQEFYERAFDDQSPGVRRFIEDEMLTESGFRESLAEERVLRAFAAAGASAVSLATLVNRRLLRIEERLDLRRVELTHDVLCKVVVESRDARHAAEAREEIERQLAAERASKAAAHKALVRARQIATGCGVLAIAAIGSAIWGFNSSDRAHRAEARAEVARGEAEKLVVYLLDDFYQELEPIGRVDIVADLAKRALAYYDGLPEDLRTAETVRNRALAQVRHAVVLTIQVKNEEAMKLLTEATQVLESQRSNGDTSDIAAIGHALGLTTRARLLHAQGKLDQALPLGEQAVRILEPLSRASGSNRAVRRAYAQMLMGLGFLRASKEGDEAAITAFGKAREAWRSVDGPALDDVTAAAGFVAATSAQMNPLANLARKDEARAIGKEAIDVASRVIELRPAHMGAIRSRGFIAAGLGRVELWDLRLAESLALSEAALRDFETLVRLDPRNASVWTPLARFSSWPAYALARLGRPDRAREALRDAVALENRARHIDSPYFAGAIAALARELAVAEADAGERARAEAALETLDRLSPKFLATLGPGSFQAEIEPLWSARTRVSIDLLRGDWASARDKARAILDKAKKRQASSSMERNNRNGLLAFVAHDLATALGELNAHGEAEQAAREGMTFAEALPWYTLEDYIDKFQSRLALAVSLARQNRLAEARDMVQPIVAFHRKLPDHARNDMKRQLQLAGALHAQGLAVPAEARAAFAEAMRILDALPPEVAKLRTVVRARERVREDMRLARS